MTDALVRAAQARLTSALPGWHDATGEAQATGRDRLPAFAVTLTITDGERVGMGSDDWWHDGSLTVALRLEAADLGATARADREAAALAQAALVTRALLAAPADLDGAAWTLSPDGWEADHERADRSLAVIDVTFAVRTLGPAA